MKYKPYKNGFWNEKKAKGLFQILPFYNVLLFQILPFYNVLIEKPKIKHLSNTEFLHNFHFVMN